MRFILPYQPYINYYIQSTFDKWNLHGTEKNGSTCRMFHLSEWLDNLNLNEIEKSSTRTSLLSKISEDRVIYEYCNQKQGDGSFYVFYLIAIEFLHLKKEFFY